MPDTTRPHPPQQVHTHLGHACVRVVEPVNEGVGRTRDDDGPGERNARDFFVFACVLGRPPPWEDRSVLAHRQTERQQGVPSPGPRAAGAWCVVLGAATRGCFLRESKKRGSKLP
jgi:hypothetical protein